MADRNQQQEAARQPRPSPSTDAESHKVLAEIQALITTAYKIGHARGYDAGLREARQEAEARRSV